MESTFKGIFWAGLIGCIAWFWYAVLMPMNALVEAIGVSTAALTAIGLVATGVLRAKRKLGDPEVSAKMAKTASQAADASEQISRVGIETAAKAGTALRPKLKYLFDFSGRASRKEYVICQVLTGIVLVVCITWLAIEPMLTPLLLILLSGVSLLAFGVRRTRDTGVNQWWFLLILVPPVNLAVIVFLLLVPTDEFKDARI